MKKLRTSVALATYNGDRYLREQLTSFAAQSRLPDELVISDDGSTDQTIAIAENFGRDAPFEVRIIRNTGPRSLNENFANAISACGGDVILISDQDDKWMPDHVAELVRPFEESLDIAVACANTAYADESLRPTGRTFWDSERYSQAEAARVRRSTWPFGRWMRRRAAIGHGMAFRAQWREGVLPIGAGWNYDDWIPAVLVNLGSICMISRPLSLHRQHGAQAVGRRHASLAGEAHRHARIAADVFVSEINRWQILKSRLEAIPEVREATWAMRLIDERIRLLEARRAMRERPSMRAYLILEQLMRGRYHRAARGWLTLARDIRG